MGIFDAITGAVGLGGASDLGAGATRTGINTAVANRIRLFREATGLTEPFRESGGRALENIQANAEVGGPAFTAQSNIGRGNIGETLGRFGFNPNDIGAAQGRFGDVLGARDFQERTGKKLDLASLGSRFASSGAGAAGAAGSNIARSFLQGSQGVAQAQQTGDTARQAGLAGLFRGGQNIGNAFLLNRLLR